MKTPKKCGKSVNTREVNKKQKTPKNQEKKRVGIRFVTHLLRPFTVRVDKQHFLVQFLDACFRGVARASAFPLPG